jgi:hypothetical protein
LKWIAIPIAILTVWIGRKLYKSIKHHPERFCGLKYARRGLMASTVVVLLIAVLIGITVPERLRKRNDSLEAAQQVHALTLDRALFEYQLRFKSLPDKVTVKTDLAKLPDPDGTIAAALREMDTMGYQPRAEVAAVSTEKPTSLRGVVIRRASLTSETDDATPAGVSFNHYDLALPGEDKILGTEDDWVVQDGVVKRLAEVSKGGIGKTAGTLRP